MYRLWDREKETGALITAQELRSLADLCNYCALCPCPNIREDIIAAKTLFIDRDGLNPFIRTLEDVERVGKLCTAMPRLSNAILQGKLTGKLLKKTAGIHAERKLPIIPNEKFSAWAKQRRLNEKLLQQNRHKIAYYAGCTARYLFPQVAKSVVEVFQQNRIHVYYPEQNCCGMPSMLEGDRNLTLTFAEQTINALNAVVEEGYDVICSCPTCGYMLKIVLRQGAYYSNDYQDFVGGSEKYMKIPETMTGGYVKEMQYRLLDNSTYGRILKDDGYFSGIDPLKRIRVAEHTYDLGEYLLNLHQDKRLDDRFGAVDGRMLYYPPCHQREQGIGQPYQELLTLIPGLSMQTIQSSAYCCGIAGIMGFKRDFHQTSIQMGSQLMSIIKRINPEKLVTDCLSCRLQFNQMSLYPVKHPVEVLMKSYKNRQG
jgi:glycerol-3-phosphate dehydrogenase subunit C